MPEPRTGRIERYVGDELVVALPHAHLVLSKLANLGVTPEKPVTSPELGLAKLSFTIEQVEHGVRELELKGWARFGYAFARAVDSLADERGGMKNVSEVDKLLLGLRKLFADEYDHWSPVMGKNRYIERVVGQPHVSGGGEGEPRQPDKPFQPFERRAHEPGQGVRVGILDTKIESHSWLDGAYVTKAAAVQPPARRPPFPSFAERPERNWQVGHGTFVAGLILQSAQGAVVELRAVLDEEVDGDTWTVATELVRLAESDVHLVNLSLGTFADDGQPPLVMERAVERLGSRIVIVAAAGNHGNAQPGHGDGMQPEPNSAFWPAAFTDVVAVGAVDAQLDDAPFSPRVPWVDITAPGVNVTSTYLEGRVKGERGSQEFSGFAQWNGTSFSAAIVSGVIAARTRPGYRSAPDVVRDLLASAEVDNAGRPFVALPRLRG